MRSGIRKKFDTFYGKTETQYRVWKTRSDAKKIYKSLGPVTEQLHQEYINDVLPYWKSFNMKPAKYWFRLCSKDGIHTDKRYIPDDLWWGTIQPYYGNMFFRRAYEDKCMHNVLFPELQRPRTIVKNMAGQYYSDDMKLLTPSEAFKLCKEEKAFIIKPSFDSGEGRLIQFYDAKKNSTEDIKKMLLSLKNNFIVQEIVPQHTILSSIHESSLNTIRVLSFFFEGEIHILSCILRMGAGAQRVDNVSAGGLQCGLDMHGNCFAEACTKNRRWITKHPGGTVFADIQIPAFEKIIELVKREHCKLPHFRLIGWDFSVNVDEEPVFIEYNVCPGPNQMTCGPTFGKLTDRVLEDVLIKKTLAAIQN